jgi:hypothetical protein
MADNLANIARYMLRVVLCIVAIPLVLGGLVAAGESGDVRPLVAGMITATLAAVTASWGTRARTPDTTEVAS